MYIVIICAFVCFHPVEKEVIFEKCKKYTFTMRKKKR